MWRVLFILNSLVVVIMASLAPFIFLLGDDQLVRYVMLCWKREETLLPCLCKAFCLNFCLRGSWCLAGALIDLRGKRRIPCNTRISNCDAKVYWNKLDGVCPLLFIMWTRPSKKEKRKNEPNPSGPSTRGGNESAQSNYAILHLAVKKGIIIIIMAKLPIYPNIASEKVIRNLPLNEMTGELRYLGCISISDCCIWKISFF